jgi:hypothetical protein
MAKTNPHGNKDIEEAQAQIVELLARGVIRIHERAILHATASQKCDQPNEYKPVPHAIGQ